jgi:hypothetical protein
MDRLARDPSLVLVRRGVYAEKTGWDALAPWERYLARVHAAAATLRHPVFCLESAAVLQGIPVFDEPRDIHLRSGTSASWKNGDLVVHGSSDTRTLHVEDGITLTRAVDTSVDLCRVLPPAQALAVADHAQRSVRSRGSELDLAAYGRAQRDRRGLRQLDWVQERADADAESAGESISRAVIEWLGYPAPQLQVEFRSEGFIDRVDFFFPKSSPLSKASVIGESDGYGKYDATSVEATKAHFVNEKRREDRLRRQADGFARWDWGNTIAYAELDARLRSAGLVPVRPRQQAFLDTLSAEIRPRAKRTHPSVRR